jgi:hypothetical protein
MADDDLEIKTFAAARKTEAASRRRSDMWSTAIASAVAGVLGFSAFQTWAHAALFAFIVFSVSVVGNRVTWELRDQRLVEEERRLAESLRPGKVSERH